MAEDIPPRPARPCPICGKPSKPEFSPFCSARCRDVDLNRWLSGSYAIPVKDEPDSEDAAPSDDDGEV